MSKVACDFVTGIHINNVTAGSGQAHMHVTY